MEKQNALTHPELIVFMAGTNNQIHNIYSRIYIGKATNFLLHLVSYVELSTNHELCSALSTHAQNIVE